jgi:hypothetical protein
MLLALAGFELATELVFELALATFLVACLRLAIGASPRLDASLRS